MNKAEFGKFAMALKTYYPRENLLPNEQALELWFNQLQDIEYKLAEVALNKWVATNKWSPSIADIREAATAVIQGEKPDWGEGWEQVQRAIRLYGSYSQEQALESMDDITRQAVRQIGWKNLCMSEHEAADRANFRMIFERQAERKRQDAQLPQALRQLISETRIGMIERSAD